ncbi:MAG: 2-amino-4-hydroxy-6-hydroxymethyldihydropteridine diphosphokinase [Cyclobacteriaceae bacterium]
MSGIYILVGGNQGNRLSYLQRSVECLKEKGIMINRCSSVYESEPWGKSDQPWFLNAVLEVTFEGSPEDLLDICLESEHDMGRIRTEKWGQRIIDIDILFYHDKIVTSEKLMLPHPRIQERKFTLIPLAELASSLQHPISNLSIEHLLSICKDPLACKVSDLTLRI